MPSLNSNPLSFGVQPDEIMPKAIYLASKRIGVVFQVGSAVSSLTPPWLPPQTLVAHLKLAGITEAPVFNYAQMRMERTSRLFRYRDLLTGSHNSLAEQSND